MRSATIAVVLLALVLCSKSNDARRQGEENWKERYRKWKGEEFTRNRGRIIGTDEAAAARLHEEGENSIEDELPSKELWMKKIEEKKQRQMKQTESGQGSAKHEEYGLQSSAHDRQRQKRHQVHSFYHEGSRGRQVIHKPPPHNKVAEMARYIVHNSDWAALAYISRQRETFGLPMADIFSISDGLANNSTGIPYMYVSPLDTGVQDLAKDSRCSLAMSLAQSDYCKQEGLDPEDPRCAHVFLTGKIKTVKNGSDEWARAAKFFFDRHPKLHNMPKDHRFRFVKLKISNILVQDYFGGPAHIPVSEYFAAKPENFRPVRISTRPVPEPEAELIPGASSSDTNEWVKPIE